MDSRIRKCLLLFLLIFYSINLLAQASLNLQENQSEYSRAYRQGASHKDLKNDTQISRPWTPVFALSGGPVWTSANPLQILALQSDITKAYALNSEVGTLGTGEAFAGLQYTMTHQFDGQIGIAVAGSGLAKLSGDVWDDADPAFNNFKFSYNVAQVRVALKGKLIATHTKFSKVVQPYLSASLGVGFNWANDYIATPRLFEAVSTPNFSANTTTSFSYTIGAGIQKSLNQHWHVGVGYELADWGKNQLGRAPGQTLGTGLSLQHLYTNEFQFTVSYSI